MEVKAANFDTAKNVHMIRLCRNKQRNGLGHAKKTQLEQPKIAHLRKMQLTLHRSIT